MDQLRKKLLDFSETPPARVWTGVESALDQELHGISKRLADYSATPPKSVWANIESRLGEKKKPAAVFLFRNKYARMAAAAAILFAVFLGVRLIVPSPETNQITVVPDRPDLSSTIPGGENPDTQLVEEPEPKKEPLIAKSHVKATSQPKAAPKKTVIARKTRYTTLSNDEGQTVRMSKKVAPVFNCAEAKMKSLSYYCQENIKLLQEKIGSSFTSPSADFAGLIDLLKTLEDDR